MGSNLQRYFFQMGARVKHVEVVPQATGWRRAAFPERDRKIVLDEPDEMRVYRKNRWLAVEARRTGPSCATAVAEKRFTFPQSIRAD